MSKPNAPDVRMVPIGELVPYANNARTHSPEQVATIAASIREFGWTVPVLTDGAGGIIAGHGRVLAAAKLRMTEVPVIELVHLSPAQKRAYILADNRIAEASGWDDDLLKIELGALKADGFDMGLTGFDIGDLDRLLGGGGSSDPDDVPEAPASPVSRLGDIWLLGDHRLLCGDSTDAGAVENLMDSEEAALCFTSPPYAQQRNYLNGPVNWDELMRGVCSLLPMAPKAQVIVNLGIVYRDNEWLPYWDNWLGWMSANGWRRFGWYVWDQGPGLPGVWHGRLAPSHEFLFHFNRERQFPNKTKEKKPASVGPMHGRANLTPNGAGSRPNSPGRGLNTHKIPDSVFRVMRHKHGTGGEIVDHPALFPVALASEVLTAFSDPGSVVYEPFSGGGTQFISAETIGRRCYGIELAPLHVDVSVIRWQAFTGQAATLASDGRAFAAVAYQRSSSDQAG